MLKPPRKERLDCKKGLQPAFDIPTEKASGTGGKANHYQPFEPRQKQNHNVIEPLDAENHLVFDRREMRQDQSLL